MPIYRVYIDGIDTGNTVTATDYVNAYFDVSSSNRIIPYRNEVSLIEINQPQENE